MHMKSKMSFTLVLIGLSITTRLITFGLERESPTMHREQASPDKETLYLVEDENQRWCGYSTEAAWHSAAEKVQDHLPVAVVEYEKSRISRVQIALALEDSGIVDDYVLGAEEPNRMTRTTRNLRENFDDEQTWEIHPDRASFQERKPRTLNLQPLKDTSIAPQPTPDGIVLHTRDFEFFTLVRDRKTEILSKGFACNPLRPGQTPKPIPAMPKGSILLTVADGGAVYLDSNKVADLAPGETYQLKDLKPGLHQFRIEKPGTLPIYRLVLLPANQVIPVSLKFTNFVPAPQKMEFMHIDPGEFDMGCAPEHPACFEDNKAHHVRITKSFEIAKYVVTQAQWQEVMGGNPSYVIGPTLPVDNVSWDDAQQFLLRLTATGDGYRYRLATEAEWEFAARTVPGLFFAASLDTSAGELPNAHDSNVTSGASDAKQISANNEILEFVQDWKDDNYYKTSSVVDPKGPENGTSKVVRSGSWGYASAIGTLWGRGSATPMMNAVNYSFRCVREPLR
jgi:formylglycine-generating enzyme required for sulfatase activity